MMKQVRPYLAVVANGFVRRVGVGCSGDQVISTAEYVRPCGDGCHQRKQEACSGDQWNCPRIAGYRRAPIGSEKTGPILEARACGIEACGIFDLTSATLPHNLHKQPRQSSSIALLFSFLLLHWLRSTRDPRRYTRLA